MSTKNEKTEKPATKKTSKKKKAKKPKEKSATDKVVQLTLENPTASVTEIHELLRADGFTETALSTVGAQRHHTIKVAKIITEIDAGVVAVAITVWKS